MTNQEKQLIRVEAELFIDHLKPEKRPQVFFIFNEHINESKIDSTAHDNIICFNMHFLQKLQLDFAMLIVHHEIYHFIKQGIKNAVQVAELKYGNIWGFMQLYDIEADLYVVDYLRKMQAIRNFDRYLEILHAGATTFKNPNIRPVKLERFIGSLTTIKLYFETDQIRLYLPKLYLDTIIMMVVDFEAKGMQHRHFALPAHHLDKWKLAYQDGSDMGWNEYINYVNGLINDFIQIK